MPDRFYMNEINRDSVRSYEGGQAHMDMRNTIPNIKSADQMGQNIQ